MAQSFKMSVARTKVSDWRPVRTLINFVLSSPCVFRTQDRLRMVPMRRLRFSVGAGHIQHHRPELLRVGSGWPRAILSVIYLSTRSRARRIGLVLPVTDSEYQFVRSPNCLIEWTVRGTVRPAASHKRRELSVEDLKDFNDGPTMVRLG